MNQGRLSQGRDVPAQALLKRPSYHEKTLPLVSWAEGFVTFSKIYMKSVCVLNTSVDSGGFEICLQRLVISLR